MPTVSVKLRNVAGTEAASGWAAAHTVVVDRPEGHAGGRGIGFNGAQLLALTIGGARFRTLEPGESRRLSVTIELEEGAAGDDLLTPEVR
jgi:hypothetical protein